MKSFIEALRRKREKYAGRPFTGKILFFILGILTTAWFLIRVIPKPQRATYPCMRASAPIMSGFIVYLLTVTGTFKAFSMARLNLKKAKIIWFGVFALIAAAGSLALLLQHPVTVFAKSNTEWIITPNKPLGAGMGIFPGRVTWVYNSKAAAWDGSTGFWWEDKFTPQAESDKLMNESILLLTGEKTLAKAWEALFVSFNKSKKGKAEGYRSGQKIAIKINENNNNSHSNNNEVNASPQMTLALLRTLINDGGVPEKNIIVFDASRFITDNIYDKCHKEFPEVVFVDFTGGDGRVKSTYTQNAIPYSVNNGKLDRGLATCATGADYLINLALLKGHVGQGVTLCAKNYYGVTSIDADWHKNAHDNFDQDREGKPRYMTFVDFLGHKDLGGKTMLFLIDGLYGSRLLNGTPVSKWKMAPFNNSWSGSLFASQDGVAIDAVGLDFLRSEFADLPDIKFGDQYLIEAALADNPPSKTKYDPERDGSRLKSLGVMEHWNNPVEKKYSRNLGKTTGIELISQIIK